MSKMNDEICLDCSKFDDCTKSGSKNCEEYEYYKCKGCPHNESNINETKCTLRKLDCGTVNFCVIR